MPRALGFDGDSAYYESLRTKVLADEEAKKLANEEAAQERRKSLGLPEEEHQSRKHKDPERKKSIGEKVMNFIWNGNRTEEREVKQAAIIGGLKDKKAGKVEEHGTPEIIR